MACSAHQQQPVDAYLNDVATLIDLKNLLKPLSLQQFRNTERYARLPNILQSGNSEDKQNFIRTCIIEDQKEFVMLLLHTGQYDAALIIEPTVSDILDAKRLDPSDSQANITCPYITSAIDDDRLVKPAKVAIKTTNIYPMTKNPRGYCVLINNYLTYGTFKEMQRFRNIFYQLHYQVIMEHNLSASRIVELLTRLSNEQTLDTHEAFICIIVSHGNNNSEILGFDDTPVDIRQLCNIFNDSNCPKLAKKPRTFVFNCCRGDEDCIDEKPASLGLAESFQQWKPRLPKIRDFLICYSTLNGYAAYVNWNDGTVFGGVLSKFIVEKAWDRDINSILTRTNNELTDLQPFDWEQSFRHDFYFNPGVPNTINL